MKPRTFNRRIAAISSLYRWASEPSRSSVTGVPRNPMPPRSLLHAPKKTRGLSDEQMGLLFAAITRAAHIDRNAQSDYVLIKGAYLLGCRVSEIAAIRWKDIEVLDGGGQIDLLDKGSKGRTVRISPHEQQGRAVHLNPLQEMGLRHAEPELPVGLHEKVPGRSSCQRAEPE